MSVTATDIGEHVARVQAAVRDSERLRPLAGGSKSALSSADGFSLAEVSGMLEYEPLEYTFTALAGTPLREVKALLAAEKQYLPFDPPLAEQGATLGGTVAAGLSGPGRFRYGGVRDFLLGVRFVSGEGELVTGGGKVVKNAAGFDFPKLMVGALGQFGVMLELTFKVFPLPEAYTTLIVELPSLEEAVNTLQRLAISPFELTCLDFVPPGRILLRIGGWSEALPGRLARLQALIGHEGNSLDDDEAFWAEAKAFGWLPGEHSLVKIPLSPQQIPDLETSLGSLGFELPRRYSVGGNLLWLGWPDGVSEGLERLLDQHDLAGLALTGTWQTPLLGRQRGAAFLERVRTVLDPAGKFALSGDAHAT